MSNIEGFSYFLLAQMETMCIQMQLKLVIEKRIIVNWLKENVHVFSRFTH
jgi:hypothetical protein